MMTSFGRVPRVRHRDSETGCPPRLQSRGVRVRPPPDLSLSNIIR